MVLNGEIDKIQNKQRTVNLLLNWGVFFTFFWVVGLGSLISIILALKAKKIANQAERELDHNSLETFNFGGFRFAWCLFAGSIGIIIGILGLWEILFL